MSPLAVDAMAELRKLKIRREKPSKRYPEKSAQIDGLFAPTRVFSLSLPQRFFFLSSPGKERGREPLSKTRLEICIFQSNLVYNVWLGFKYEFYIGMKSIKFIYDICLDYFLN